MSECQVVASEIVLPELGKQKFICELCSISFTHRKNLNKHLRVFHQLQLEVRLVHTCVLCEEKFRNMIVLHEHLQNQHSITLKFVYETFYSEKDFQDWKNKIEEESLSSYVVRNNIRKKIDGITTSYYICNRSGHHKVKQNRVRSLKAAGSIKTGNTCPAFIKAITETVDGISEIKVQYQSVHLGHEFETRALFLRKEDRENLAACLKLGIPMDKILEDARQNVSPTSRYSLLTRKHLHNIRRAIMDQQNKEKSKASAQRNADVEVSDNSIGAEDNLETEISNHEEIQEHLKTTVSNHEELQEHDKNMAVSTLLQLQQNHDYSEEFNTRKMQIIDRLKQLQSRIEQWNPKCPLPEIENYFKAMNAYLDISASTNGALYRPAIRPNKPATKQRKISKTKGSKKSQQN